MSIKPEPSITKSFFDRPTRILVIDDSALYRQAIQNAIHDMPEVSVVGFAKNGIEALEMLTGTNGHEKLVPRPSVILLDLNMPQMNGHEFLQELRSDPELKPISVYVLSTSGDDKDRMEAFEKNVAGYILKPLTLEDYVEAINTLNKYWQLTELP